MRHPVHCCMYNVHTYPKYEQTRLLSYIYKCTELRFYHKANMILKQQKITHVFHDEQTKKKNVRKEKTMQQKKTDERYDI